MNDQRLRTKLSAGEFFVVPGIQDMIAAVVADRVGFDVIYGTGFWLTASAYGLPDAGIATYTQMHDRMATLAQTSTAAVIADAFDFIEKQKLPPRRKKIPPASTG